MIPMLAQLPQIAINLMVVGFLLICLIMILTVLIQKPQGGGLSGAFGSGAGSGQTAFGARTGDALTVATIGIFVFYIIAAIGLNFVVKPSTAAPIEPQAQGEGETAPAPTVPGTTGTTAPTPIKLTPVQAPGNVPAPTPGTAPGTTPPATTPPATAPGTTPPATAPGTTPGTTEPAGTPATTPATTPAAPTTPPASSPASPAPATPPTTPPANPG